MALIPVSSTEVASASRKVQLAESHRTNEDQFCAAQHHAPGCCIQTEAAHADFLPHGISDSRWRVTQVFVYFFL